MASRIFRLVAANTTNLTKVTDRNLNLAALIIVNTTAAIIYVKLYLGGSSGSTPTDAAPTVGTTTPWLTFQCAASVMTTLPLSIPITSGQTVWVATTANAVDSDATAIGAGPIIQIAYE
jgi:hypothetical protein